MPRITKKGIHEYRLGLRGKDLFLNPLNKPEEFGVGFAVRGKTIFLRHSLDAYQQALVHIPCESQI